VRRHGAAARIAPTRALQPVLPDMRQLYDNDLRVLEQFG
jgi:hypothetical protein